MVANILVPLDGSQLAERALPYAAALARTAGGRLILVRAAQAHVFPGTDPGPAQLAVTERAETELDDVANRLRADGLDVEPHVYYDDPAEAILDAARRRKADLIVMSTHGRTGLGRWIYGSVADTVLRRAELPILLIPAAARDTLPTDRTPRIIVPLDGSELAEEALSTAERVAIASGAELILLRVVEPPTYTVHGEGYAYIPFNESFELAEAKKYLEAMVARLRATGHTVDARAVVGQPASEIARAAREEQADLIAMATHGRGGLARLVMGSIATGTIQRAEIPLLLTRPKVMHAPPIPVSPSEPVVAVEGPTVTMALSAQERELIREGLELLLANHSRKEHIAQPIRGLLARMRQAGSASPSGTENASSMVVI